MNLPKPLKEAWTPCPSLHVQFLAYENPLSTGVGILKKTFILGSLQKLAKKLLASGVPPRDVAKNLGVSVPTLYRWIPASSQA